MDKMQSISSYVKDHSQLQKYRKPSGGYFKLVTTLEKRRQTYNILWKNAKG